MGKLLCSSRRERIPATSQRSATPCLDARRPRPALVRMGAIDAGRGLLVSFLVVGWVASVVSCGVAHHSTRREKHPVLTMPPARLPDAHPLFPIARRERSAIG